MTATIKACYKITNWRIHNESLVRRGDIAFWFDEDVIDAWEHDNDEPNVGRPFTYSDLAVECWLALREPFRLPNRHTEGLGGSLVKLMQAEVAIPEAQLRQCEHDGQDGVRGVLTPSARSKRNWFTTNNTRHEMSHVRACLITSKCSTIVNVATQLSTTPAPTNST
jgi:hypothetical protein